MQPIILRRIEFLSGEDFIYGGKLPTRMLYLRDMPEYKAPWASLSTAWQALKSLQAYKPLIFSDIYRSPASSAEAYARKTGVAKPGYSGHNYGISVDLAIDVTLKRHHWSYIDLCMTMVAYGWTPYQGHKIDNNYKRGKEDWHFNYISDYAGTQPGSYQVNNWINAHYTFESDPIFVQTALKKLKFYQGEIDGSIGPLSIEAIKKFQRAWLPKTFGVTGKLDPLTIRVLNIVSCDVLDTEGNLII